MVKKTQAAKNALHVSKNYAYLKPSTLRSMAKEISGTRLEACKSYAVSRLPKIAVTATLASLLACGAGLPTHQAWANGFNLPDGSYRYANRDSSTKAQRYVDIKQCHAMKNKTIIRKQQTEKLTDNIIRLSTSLILRVNGGVVDHSGGRVCLRVLTL